MRALSLMRATLQTSLESHLLVLCKKVGVWKGVASEIEKLILFTGVLGEEGFE